MKLYLKILLATVLGSLLGGTLIGITVGVGSGSIDDFLWLMPLASGYGFAVFGISGSVLWYLIYCYIFSKWRVGIKGHLPSVLFSSVLCSFPNVVYEALDHQWNFNQFPGWFIPRSINPPTLLELILEVVNHLGFMMQLSIVTVPGAFLSLFIYWLIFLRGRTTQNTNIWLGHSNES